MLPNSVNGFTTGDGGNSAILTDYFFAQARVERKLATFLAFFFPSIDNHLLFGVSKQLVEIVVESLRCDVTLDRLLDVVLSLVTLVVLNRWIST